MLLQDLKHRFAGEPVFNLLFEAAERIAPGTPVLLTGLAGSFRAITFSMLQERLSRQLLVIAHDPEAAEQLRDDLSLSLRPDAVRYFAGHETHGIADATKDVNDIQTLRSLLTSPPALLVTHPEALASRIPPPSTVRERSFTLENGTVHDLAALQRKLNSLGFQHKDFVETYGDYAVRGGILDVFPFVGENPVRVEFFGDTIESIREFDPLSQRSIKDLSIAVIVPDLLSTPEGTPAEGNASLLDYLTAEALVILEEPDLFRNAIRESTLPGVFPLEELEPQLELFPRFEYYTIVPGGADRIDFDSVSQPAFNASIAALQRDLAALHMRGFTTVITCDGQSELTRLRDLLTSVTPEAEEEEPLPPLDIERVHFSLEAVHAGFLLPSARFALYTEHQIFNRLKRRGRRRTPRFKGITEKELHQLRKGDYVVHQDYGIGRFQGLKKIKVRNAEQEVVAVSYDQQDTLYVNLDYIHKLQKYSSKEGHVPKLTRLGSPEWERLKSRVKKRVKDIARDLIKLYARRKHLTGFAFSRDMPWQKELEASFMYEDTFDQAKATIDVKRDMEEPSPMDRLICGDVGFGKTEVAVRSAFKAVLDGKQAAVLVPTTILAMQHYNTFRDRTLRYGVNVQVLSRFKSRKEQKLLLDQLKAGGVDIVIGTHRLLSKDVAFKDLGLLIIDEEHRFGVAAKERLRQMRTEVDTLSLTATPIPRTLHFSLMGARDLSIIATPPRNRLPIMTEIVQWNDDVLRDAILRELNRGGQVYFVHDRIHNIDEVTARLHEIVPTGRLRVAHGRMHAHELEEVMMDFLEKKFDVLVATKIIESGLDIPSVNTIIINRADRFGMAELYQLRGRVGRSNVQAYAYLLTPPVSVLPRPTLQRLQAMEEFTELGSGFNLAMRDLEIRGAGNLLGAEQSGFIETMGFETYTRILEEAVQELKEQEFQDLFPAEPQKRKEMATLVEVESDAYIPEEYIGNDVERLAVYRRLYALSTEAQLQEVGDELRDRFGPIPPEVENLFMVVRIRLAASRIGFVRVGVSGAFLEAHFPPEQEAWFYEGEDFQRLMGIVSHMKSQGVFLRQNEKEFTLTARPKKAPDVDPLQQALRFLLDLHGQMERLRTPA